jgi:fucose 4-O-acetylase-like acetyltransferase
MSASQAATYPAELDKRNSTTRSPLIDIAKGLGILLIVLGHNTVFGDHYQAFSNTLMAFRLPFFFFISGVTLSLRHSSVRTVMIERADAWLKPCVVVIIALGVLKIARHSADLESLLVGLSFGTGFTLAWTPLWFLPHLWLIYVVASALLIRGGSWLTSPLSKTLLLIFCCIGGYQMLQVFDSSYDNQRCVKQLQFSSHLFECGLPFSADLLLVTLFYVLCGHFLAAHVKAFKPRPILTLLAVAGLVAMRSLFPYKLDLNSRLYEHLLLTPLTAMLGIYVLLSLCDYLGQSDYLSRTFKYFGRTSLFILIFHAPIQYSLLRALAPRFNSEYVTGTIAYICAVTLSVGIYHVCRSNRYLAALMFPRQQRVPSTKA